jgi:hypothetical protein
MRVPGSWRFLLAAGFASNLALAQPVAPAPEPAADEPSPPAEAPPPASEPAASPRPAAATAPAARDTEVTPSDTRAALPPLEPPSNFNRNYHALPLTLEARLGFNARLGSSFDGATQEERSGASYAFAAYLGWRREFALGLELDHNGLGSVRALSGQNSIDHQYTATTAWLAARAFPIRRERLDFFVNLRVGMAFQHVDAFGTRQSVGSITVPAQSYTCSEWDGPGVAIGGGVGAAYRLGRHVSFASRLDLSGARLSGEGLGTCADGLGSVASLSGSVGLAFEFETAPR